jgi:hypothetical protein
MLPSNKGPTTYLYIQGNTSPNKHGTNMAKLDKIILFWLLMVVFFIKILPVEF